MLPSLVVLAIFAVMNFQRADANHRDAQARCLYNEEIDFEEVDFESKHILRGKLQKTFFKFYTKLIND